MNKLILDDRTIRKSLISRLTKQSKTPKAILEELRVHNGNAVADVVTIHTKVHCYEIKGETDNIHRILKQSQYYDLVFKKITLVTVEIHRRSALRLAPPHWGIILARKCNDDTKLSYIRPALISPMFEKRLALLTLWKSELIDVASSSEIQKAKKLNRFQLSNLLATTLSDEAINRSIGDKLTSRNCYICKSRIM